MALLSGFSLRVLGRVFFFPSTHVPEAWHTFGYTGTDPKDFLQEFQDVWPLLLPKNECEKVLSLSAEEPLSKVKEEVQVLFESCEAGKVLFSSAIKGIASDLLSDKIENGMTKLLKGPAAVDETAINNALRQIHEDIQTVPGLETLQGRRSVAMTYKQLRLLVPCADPREQASLMLRLRVRERAASTDVLRLLPGECYLPTTTKATFAVAASAVSKASTARLQLKRLLDAETDDGLSGDTVLVPGHPLFCLCSGHTMVAREKWACWLRMRVANAQIVSRTWCCFALDIISRIAAKSFRLLRKVSLRSCELIAIKDR